FVQYQHLEEQPTSLNDNHISALMVDQDNRLWIGTLSGLDRFKPETGTFHHYPYTSAQATAEDSSIIDPDSISNADSIKYYPGISTKSDKSSSKNISTIYQDSRGRFWIGTSDGGLNGFDPQTGIFTIYQSILDGPTTISSDRVTAITEDLDGNLWIGTKSGLNLFNAEKGEFTLFSNEKDNPLTLADDSVNSLYADNSGNLWVGTSNGLDRLLESRDRFVHYHND